MAQADDWPQCRGPNRDNVWNESSILQTFHRADEYLVQFAASTRLTLSEAIVMDWLRSLQMHEILVYGVVFCVPLLVIGAQAVVAIVKAVIKHRERMALIEQGLNPDWPPEQPTEEEYPARTSGMDETQPYVPPR
jgi:hypothetical protein